MKVDLTDDEVHFITQMCLVFYSDVGKYTEHAILLYRQVAKKLGIEKELKESHAWRRGRKPTRETMQREWRKLLPEVLKNEV